VKRIATAFAALVAAFAWSAAPASAATCGLPDTQPLWVEYAEGTVDFRGTVFRRPGLVLASSGTTVPRELRAGGASTVYWQMRLSRIVGTPAVPADPASIPSAANELVDRAAASSDCATPLIALEELSGSHLPTPWSLTNRAYRANVLELVRTIAARGARPFVFIHGTPATAGAAGEWWLSLSLYADIVYESYFRAPSIHRLGPFLASRTLRTAMRRPIRKFAVLGVPADRLGLMLGFHSKPGTGGREGLGPREAWFEFVKLNALAARQVAADEGIGSIWSWGWGTFDEAGADPDKAAAACVYLWTRDGTLCDAPAAAGPAFDTSTMAGQILLPTGIRCAFPSGMVSDLAVQRLAPLAGNQKAALTALIARRALRRAARLGAGEVLAAERRIVDRRFRGSYRRYAAALRGYGLTRRLAHDVIADGLRVRRLGVRAATARLTGAVDSALCLRDELPGRMLVDLTERAWFLRLA
jgi:hypothetical protein